MRLSSIILLFGVPLLVNAQQWTLLRPGWKYNYMMSDTGAIDAQIFITSIDTFIPGGHELQLNRIGVNQPQFLRRFVRHVGNSWEFRSPGTAFILPHEALGSTWVMDTIMNVTAEVTDVDTVIQFGVEDVQKEITSANGDVWVVSREWGVLRMNEWELVGIHGPDVGMLVPSIFQMFPYQPGDVMQFRKGASGPSFCGWYPYGSLTLRSKHTVIERVESDSSIEFNTSHVYWNTFTTPMGSTQSTTTHQHGSLLSEWVTSPSELPYRDLLFSYPGQAISSDHVLCRGSTGFDCIAQHSIDSLGRYCMSCELETSCVGPNRVRYIEGIGFENYTWNCLGPQESYRLVGCIIGGDTIGTIDPDWYFVGLSENSTHRIVVFPNPANDHLNLDGLDPGISTYAFWDAQGRIVLRSTLSGPSATFDVSMLDMGIYYLSGLDPVRSIPVKVIIAR